MTEPRYVLGDRNYRHPEGKHLFPGSTLALSCITGILQIIATALFALYGYGYAYVFMSVALLHIYMYRQVFNNLKDKTQPTNLYSLVEGYLLIPLAVYSVPLMTTALLTLISAGNSMSDTFVENNQTILSLLAHFKLTALPPHLDPSNLINAVYIYYLGLTAFSAIFCFVLSLPFLWLMSKGWSDFFDANPKQFFFLRKIACLFFMAGVCIWCVYTNYNDWVRGIETARDGSLRFISWKYALMCWLFVGTYLAIALSGFIGSLVNVIQHLQTKNSQK